MNKEHRQRAFDAVEKASELPMLILALAIIPLLVVPLAFELSSTAKTLILALEWMIWAAFALELTAKTYLAPRRLAYLRRHWFDVIIVAVPFLRPLRVIRSARLLRLLRLMRVASAASRSLHSARTILGAHGLNYILLLALVLIVVAAGVVTIAESGGEGTISDFDDGLWWAVTTVTTVGYGDKVPVTAEGRAIAAVLMIVGITLFSLLTANIAAFLVKPDTQSPTLEDVMTQLESIKSQLDEMKAAR